MEGRAFVDGVLAALQIEPICAIPLREKIPADGPILFVANHHFGGADALLALSLLSRIRPDLKIVANRLLASFPQTRDSVIPVAPPSVRRRRIEGTRNAMRHLQAGKALLVFPSGQVAGRNRKGNVEDGPWKPGVGRLIQKFQADVVPVAFEGQNSRLFYLARSVHFRLGTFLLLRELLNKTGKRIPVHVGSPIPYARVADISDPGTLMEYLRSVTYGLMHNGPAPTTFQR